MYLNLNAQLLPHWPPALEQVQRALFYGDALFETCRVLDGHLPLWERHWARLSRGLALLGIELPDGWNAAFFRQEILRTAPPNARARLTVWRQAGGLYLPEQHRAEFLITCQPLDTNRFEWLEPGLELGLCQRVRLPLDDFSNLKTMNAARYAAAAREAREAGWQDGLLLNSRDRICEASASNIFWWEGERLLTVPLSEGCVAGVLREALLEFARTLALPVQEKSATFATLQAADEIFLTNAVRGIMPVRIFAGRKTSQEHTRKLHAAFSTALVS